MIETSIQLSPLRRRDIRRCVQIEKELFTGDGPWTAAAFRSELDSGAYYLGAYSDTHGLVGYGGLATGGTPGAFDSNLHTIGVAPAFQGNGIGTALLRALLARADELASCVFLEVRTDNEKAVALYERHGFATVGRRKRYYQPSGADAYTMRRSARETGVTS